jgi:hypothetical protein
MNLARGPITVSPSAFAIICFASANAQHGFIEETRCGPIRNGAVADSVIVVSEANYNGPFSAGESVQRCVAEKTELVPCLDCHDAHYRFVVVRPTAHEGKVRHESGGLGGRRQSRAAGDRYGRREKTTTELMKRGPLNFLNASRSESEQSYVRSLCEK